MLYETPEDWQRAPHKRVSLFGMSGLGKTRIAETADTRFFDTGLQNGRPYHYGVIAVGISDSCMGPMSACTTVTPGGAAGALAFTSRTPELVSVKGGDRDPVIVHA